MRKPRADGDGHVLNVHAAVTANGQVRVWPGARLSDDLTWFGPDGEEAGTLGYVFDVGADGATGTLQLDFALNGRAARQAFDLVGRPCRFGGRRWLAVCPDTSRPVAKLYSAGDGLFRPRHAVPLAYRSQDRVPAAEKLRKREAALLERLGVIEGWPWVQARPKRMRQATYRRLVDALGQVQAARRAA